MVILYYKLFLKTSKTNRSLIGVNIDNILWNITNSFGYKIPNTFIELVDKRYRPILFLTSSNNCCIQRV